MVLDSRIRSDFDAATDGLSQRDSLQPAITFPNTIRCIERGIRRSVNTFTLFKKPGTTLALSRMAARTALLATTWGFILNALRRSEDFSPATAPKAVAVVPGETVVTDTPRAASS